MKIDTQQTLKQLELLGYSEGEKIYYRLIPGKGYKGRTLNQVAVYPNVFAEQDAEHGVYFVVNGGGRKDSDVAACRAFFAEWDDRPIDEQENLWEVKGFPRPTFQVKTRKSVHCYWVLNEAIAPDKWKEIQAQLLDVLDADRCLKNPSRVLRVAGAWHVMAGEEPVECSLLNVTGQKFDLPQIEEAIAELTTQVEPPPFDIPLPQPQPQPQPQPPTPRTEPGFVPPIPLYLCLPLRQRDLLGDGARSGERNQKGFGLAKDLISTESYLMSEGISFRESARDLFWDFCRHCDPSPDWDEREWEVIWRSAQEKAPARPPLDPDKIENCLKKWAKTNGVKTTPKPVLTSKPLAVPQPESVRVYGGTKPLNAGELAKFVEDNIASRLSFDELRTEVLLDGQKLTLGNDLKFWFLKNFGEVANKDDVYDCFTFYARQNAFNPLEQYLKGLTCEPVPINNLATRYFGQSEPIYNRMVEMWLISCVARALTPLDDPNQTGTQVDHTLILQSGQGKYKSTWFKTLGGKWFSDSVKDIESKDSLMIVHSNWIIELSELDRITSKKQAGAIKHWLTQRCDSFRKPYAREIDPNLPRRCVFCGTVNPKTFLVDDENRRFWIVPIADSVSVLDISQLERERDGIWRAAYLAYLAGAPWWPTEEEKAAIAEVSHEFKETDAWEEAIAPYLLDKDTVSALEILTECLKFEKHQVKRADEMRVNKILDGLGWNKSTRKWEVDPLTQKKVARRVRLAPNSQNLQKGWIVGSSQDLQGIGADPTSTKGWIRLDHDDPTSGVIQPSDPTSNGAQTHAQQGTIQRSDLIQHFPNSGEEKTKNDNYDLARQIKGWTDAAKADWGWTSEQMREFIGQHFPGKTKPNHFNETEAKQLLILLSQQTVGDESIPITVEGYLRNAQTDWGWDNAQMEDWVRGHFGKTNPAEFTRDDLKKLSDLLYGSQDFSF